ncbi:histidine phosphatase family protein [Aerococcus sp. Group 1]|uniref:histidine phosphatase family protein n=1 Tax=Aerococcus urinae (strain CCUG 59500 / ACS-120-V-Col10a) TaxID=2976812 RepID=UPI000200FBBE|nr:histidine phosphatase family protein [Aerococcus sp. Group 1]AEA00297.1 phosphoglycerate mutase family protein [Aerococcus sp. Group 1]MCY3031094.1 histidine phosphatase family protein [Aerococcus sp. Group 1]MCY3054186.1 histidine phosphatase family protein [Aerococcus sp. Group 1]MCY3055916.1 histidine phosphatase family protein [Aerococcus sp. Group 1]MCY3061639.1 histidine phosphatase family protein [Aerococcus sp. Group 1]
MVREIFIIRHGQSLYNLEGKIQGQIDSPLSPRGIQEAEQAKNFFDQKDISIDLILSSPLKRAYATAKIIQGNSPCPLVTDQRLAEWRYGSLEGKALSVLEGVKLNDPPSDHYFCQFGGESVTAVKVRFQTALDEALKAYPQKNILLVSHGSIMYRFMLDYLNQPLPAFSNCQIFHFEELEKSLVLKNSINPLN